MKLIDILPVEIWRAIEKEANEKFGLNASVFDADGRRITGKANHTNRLCPAIAATKDGQTHICARAHQDIVSRVRRHGEAAIGECDAGMVKILVPITVDGEFLGAFGGCGRPLEDEGIDAFYISKVTGIPESEVESLGRDIPALTEIETREVANFLAARVRAVFEEHPKP
ncbi:MAG: PocR ligand-binding domain-containing protein [Rhodospirillales bacterium]|jgi:ligand-binding sensor protein|nr:PocR ligand-binding domain-containing protein [Rhodospirillales bacterium]